MPNLTDTLIRSAKPPERGQVMLTDVVLPNFGIRLSQGGSKTFVVMLGRGRRHTIGRYPLVSLADARKEARRILAEKELGRIHPTRTPFAEAMDTFITDCATRIRPRTLTDYTRLLQHFQFGRIPIADITARDIYDQLKPLTSYESHHAFTIATIFFRWAVRQHLIDRSPTDTMAVPYHAKPRERILSPDELKAVYSTARNGDTAFHRIVSLLVLTGQRRGEIVVLQWDWINEDERTICIPSTATKNARRHVFPYGVEVQTVLNKTPRYDAPKDSQPYLFPATRKRSDKTTVVNGFSKQKARLDVECGVSGWTLHDLRRTYSSTMAALGVPQVVVEKLLNHVSGGTLSPIASVYNRHAYMNEMRDAVLRYEAYLTTLIAPTA